MVSAWTSTALFLLQWQRASVPDFQRTADRTQRPGNDLHSFYVGTPECSAPINDKEVSQQHVENVGHKIHMKPGIFNTIFTSVQQKADSCVEIDENHIYLLYRSHKHCPYLSRYRFLDVCCLGLFPTYLNWVIYPFKPMNIFQHPVYNTLAQVLNNIKHAMHKQTQERTPWHKHHYTLF